MKNLFSPTLLKAIGTKTKTVNENLNVSPNSKVEKFSYFKGITMNDDDSLHNNHIPHSCLLEGNKSYVKEKTNIDADYFKNLAKTQKPKYLLIGCSDSRVPPNELTKTEPGEIFIHRNIANQVLGNDLNCMSVLQFAVDYLCVQEIIVMGHTHCGGIIAAKNNVSLGLIDQWLQNIRDVGLMHKEELNLIKDEKQFIKRLSELNVKQQVLNVCKTNIVQKAWSEGKKLTVHGWICDIETGLIYDLGIDKEEWLLIKNIYRYDYQPKI